VSFDKTNSCYIYHNNITEYYTEYHVLFLPDCQKNNIFQATVLVSGAVAPIHTRVLCHFDYSGTALQLTLSNQAIRACIYTIEKRRGSEDSGCQRLNQTHQDQ